MTYNRDMQEDKEPLFDAFHQTSGSLAMAKSCGGIGGPESGVPGRQRKRAGWWRRILAEELARQGVPFHRAHQLVGQLVLESVKTGKKPSDWTAESVGGFAPEFRPEMARLLKPSEGMKTRELPGGTGPGALPRALEKQAEARLAEMRRQIDADDMNKSFRQGQILKIIREKKSTRRKNWRANSASWACRPRK